MELRKIMLIALLMAAFSSDVIAQGITNIGFKGGLNFSTYIGDDVDEENIVLKKNLAFGCFVNYEINTFFSIQPELLFTVKGFKYLREETWYDDDGYYRIARNISTRDLSYLEIPILTKLNISLNNNVKLNTFFGPALAYNVKATYDLSVVYKTYEDSELIFEESAGVYNQDLENIKSIDYGLIFGFGIELGKFFIDTRYYMGLESIDNSSENWDLKNSVISIMLSISI